MNKYKLHLGSCLDSLKKMADNSVDSIVTDPPYALPGGFMGKQWDNHDGREDTGFGYWLAGFTDGEGCFLSKKHERGTHTCTFQIKLRRDDRKVLERIRRFVGHGTVRDVEGDGNSKPLSLYIVQDKEGCEAIVGMFRRFPLTAKKANDFEIWAEAVWEWMERPKGNRWIGQADQSHAASLKDRLENIRKYSDIPWSGHRFQDWCRQWSKECLRVLKPGGYILAFGATRQYHRLASGIEDAGFEVRDCMGWVFSSGMPKSHNLTGDWEGWGSALKPAWESIVVARKPLSEKTIAANVLLHGTGGINIDGCRVPTNDKLGGGNNSASVDRSGKNEGWQRPWMQDDAATEEAAKRSQESTARSEALGRWPANFIHDGSEEVVSLFPFTKSGAMKSSTMRAAQDEPGSVCYGVYGGAATNKDIEASSGSAARFFYCPKASKSERGEGNNHPTVKPQELMKYLCRLVTPPGGIVLDPFMGSGTTGVAAIKEGFSFVGCEMSEDYIKIAEKRISATENEKNASLDNLFEEE